MKRDAWIGFGLFAAVLALVALVVTMTSDEDVPEATGRDGDACRASGPAGVVGLDLATGDERWTNVVGDGTENLWSPGPDGDVTSGDSDSAYAVAGSGRVRQITAATGAVESCRPAEELSEDELGHAVPVDASGATARDRAAGAAEVIEADGTSRWIRDGRQLLAASAGGVATQTNPGYQDGPPTLAIEVLEPATGELRWAKEVPGLSAVATPTHLVVVDQFPDDAYPPEPGDVGKQQARITAYDLADGSEAWHVDVAGTPQQTFPDAGLILVPGGDSGGPRVTAIEDATGDVKWDVPVAQPGRGGRYTEDGDVTGAAVADGVVVVAVLSDQPYRD